MKTSEINSWWKKGIAKEVARHTNAPKPHKGDQSSVPTDFNNFAPPLVRFGKAHARQR